MVGIYSCKFLGYSTSNSSIYPLSLFLDRSSIHSKPSTGSGSDIANP